MRKRIGFHLLHLIVLVAAIVLAVAAYRSPLATGSTDLAARTLAFILERWPNFLLMAGTTYLMIYISGLSYAGRRAGGGFAEYLNVILKLVLILGMVSFMEFFLFFSSRIGRRIYLFIFLFMALFYLAKFLGGRRRDQTGMLWLLKRSPRPFLEEYPNLAAKYRPSLPDTIQSPQPFQDVVVYHRRELDDEMAVRLIRYKLQGSWVVDLNYLVEKEEERIPLDTVSVDWLMEKLNRVHRHYLRASRWLNALLASLLLLVLAIPAGLLALLHCLFSPGPLFFVQERLGINQKPFRVFKLRSMVRDAESGGARFSARKDRRVTRLGKIMRMFRLDEVPQLWNVIRGEMNLVGPRPERAVFIRDLERRLPFYRLRLLVKPGLTGWAQVKMGYAGDDVAQQRRKLEYDLFYIKNRSLALDLLILIKTLPVVLRGMGR